MADRSKYRVAPLPAPTKKQYAYVPCPRSEEVGTELALQLLRSTPHHHEEPATPQKSPPDRCVECVESVECLECVESVECLECVESVECLECVETVECLECVDCLENVECLERMVCPRCCGCSASASKCIFFGFSCSCVWRTSSGVGGRRTGCIDTNQRCLYSGICRTG